MSNRVFVAIVIVTALLAGTGAYLARPRIDQWSAAPPAMATKGRYQCAMHPQIVSDEPGTCPICGMKLERVDEPAAAGVMIRTRAGGAAKTLAMLGDKRFTERAQSRIFKRARPFDDVFPVRRLLRGDLPIEVAARGLVAGIRELIDEIEHLVIARRHFRLELRRGEQHAALELDALGAGERDLDPVVRRALGDQRLRREERIDRELDPAAIALAWQKGR